MNVKSTRPRKSRGQAQDRRVAQPDTAVTRQDLQRDTYVPGPTTSRTPRPLKFANRG